VAENLNLGLQVEEPGEAGEGSARTARVFVDSACSYLKGSGAPVISRDCESLRELESEVQRLWGELDEVLREARLRFGAEDRAAAPAEEPAGGTEASARPASLDGSLRVCDVMTSNVQTLKPNDTIRLAEELMKVGSFRHVVVVDDQGHEVVGVLSQQDICFNALAWNLGGGRKAHDRLVGEMAVKQVMQKAVQTVRPDAFLADAARVMAENKISCVPVTESDQLLGILTAGDLLALLTRAAPAGA
jgi:CBS domain-containing protein